MNAFAVGFLWWLLVAASTARAGPGFEHQLFCGSAGDETVLTAPAVLLIGGAEAGAPGELAATEWFLAQGDGGDYLVLRSGGIGGQAGWICSTFPDRVSSAAELSIDTRAAADDPEVIALIEQAELIFIAGGDQTAYVDQWRGTATAAALNQHLATAPVAGTSAGMMILGESYYAPTGSGVLSSQILDDPYHPDAGEIGHGDFLQHPRLAGVITDTHLDRAHGPGQERRYGRLLGLLARLVAAHPDRERSFAIGADEGVFIAINGDGMARVFGSGGPAGPSAWFAQQHMEGPERVSPGQGLVWERGGTAVKVYRISGTPAGHGRFNLDNWFNAEGGEWLNWFSDDGAAGFNFRGGECPACPPATPPDRERLFCDRFS